MTSEPNPLREATEDLNLALKEAEAKFIAADIGTHAEVELTPTRILCFQKFNGKQWCFVVREISATGEVTAFPLLSAPRETRIEAVYFLPSLYKNLLRAGAAGARRVLEAAAACRAWISDNQDIVIRDVEP